MKIATFLNAIITMLTMCICQHGFASEDLHHAATQTLILNDINTYRSQHGLPILTINNVLNAEARRHSQDMAAGKIPFGHAGFDNRIQRLFKAFKRSNGIAENVAYTDMEVRGVVSQWLHSSGHRHNIEGNYNLTGIGVAQDEQGRYYVTQIFLRVIETNAPTTNSKIKITCK